MARWFVKRRYGPIGVDLGSRSVKLLQFDADRTCVHEAARWDLNTDPDADPAERREEVVQSLRRAREGRDFHGREAVFCIHSGDLFVQNIRVPQLAGDDLTRTVHAEAAGRLPFASDEAEVRYFEAADVRQGDTLRREVILLACRRVVLDETLSLAEQAGLRPVAIDVEPAALLRCYGRQFRRDQDQGQCVMFVNLGSERSAVVIARDCDAMFVKYIDVGARQLDEAVARQLDMSVADASALRRHNGDRRADRRDPEVARSIAESTRPVLDHLASELSMCVRYYSVTFRGRPLGRIVFGGGEATEGLVEWLDGRFDAPCELGDPLRSYQKSDSPGRPSQWDVAAGLALRDVN